MGACSLCGHDVDADLAEIERESARIANEFASLRSQRDRLLEGLRPFAAYAGRISAIEDGFEGFVGEIYTGGVRYALSYNALRAARALIQELSPSSAAGEDSSTTLSVHDR